MDLVNRLSIRLNRPKRQLNVWEWMPWFLTIAWNLTYRLRRGDGKYDCSDYSSEKELYTYQEHRHTTLFHPGWCHLHEGLELSVPKTSIPVVALTLTSPSYNA